MKSQLLALAVLSLSLSDVRAQGPAPSGGPCALTPSLRDAVQQRFGAARVFKSSDLYEDERAIFNSEHPGACPGLIQGRFFGDKERPATAVLLIDVEPKKNLRLVVARPALSAWTFHEVDELDQGSTPVVSKKAPGTFADPRDAKARPSSDAVVLTGYESWQRVYVWNGRAFEALKLQN